MVFSLVDFNTQFRYYWWLLPSLEESLRRRTELANQRLSSTQPDGVEILNPLDFPAPDRPPLNRKCNEKNIHLTILSEYDNIWPRHDYLELYFRVYQSICNRLIRMIARTGNETHYPDHIVNMITSYLPSSLLVDSDGFRSLANVLLEKRRKQRREEKASSELTP